MDFEQPHRATEHHIEHEFPAYMEPHYEERLYEHEQPVHHYEEELHWAQPDAHRVLDHKYDDAHDVTPVPFHEHAVLPAVDRPESSSFEHLLTEHYAEPLKFMLDEPIHEESH